MNHSHGSDDHAGHDGHGPGSAALREAAPAKPGYPEHPELKEPRDGAGHAAHAVSEMGGDHASHGDDAAHDKHAGHSVAMFRNKFWITLLLTIPTLVWGEMVPRVLGFTPPALPGAKWIPVVFGTAVYFYGGWVFVRGAWRELVDRKPGMMTLISLAISVAFLFSGAVTFGFPGMPLWWELASLVTIMLLGHWMEMRSITQAQGALKELAKRHQPRAVGRDHRPHHARADAAEHAEGDDDRIRRGDGDDEIGGRESGQQRQQQRLAVDRERGADQRDGADGGGQRVDADQEADVAFGDAEPLCHLRQDARRDHLGQDADEGDAGHQAEDEPRQSRLFAGSGSRGHAHLLGWRYLWVGADGARSVRAARGGTASCLHCRVAGGTLALSYGADQP